MKKVIGGVLSLLILAACASEEHGEATDKQELGQESVVQDIELPAVDWSEYTGCWQYNFGADSLWVNANTDSTVSVVWSSWADIHVPHEVVMQLDGQRLSGDYYGAEGNFILTVDGDSLLLSIDPFHEFQPITNQVFVRCQSMVPNWYGKDLNGANKSIKTFLSDHFAGFAALADNWALLGAEDFNKLKLNEVFDDFETLMSSETQASLHLHRVVQISDDFYSLIFQYNNNVIYYNTLVNYDEEGNIIDFEQCGEGDNVEGFSFEESNFYTSYFITYNHEMTDEFVGEMPIYDSTAVKYYTVSAMGEISPVVME